MTKAVVSLWLRTLALIAVTAAEAGAQSYQNSPHVEGDAARVRVYYDQRVRNTQVKKEVFVYQGPRTEEVLAAVRQILTDQDSKLARLVSQDDVRSLRADMLKQLHQHFSDQPDIIASIKQILAKSPKRHRGHWDLGVGVSGVIAGGAGLGGHGLLSAHLDVHAADGFRYAIGLQLGFEVLDRVAYTRTPAGAEIDETSRISFHGWGAPSFQAWWLSKHVSLQFSALLGAQAFEAGLGARPYVTYGAALTPEVHIGQADATGANIGLSWRVQSMTRPVFEFKGLQPAPTPERTWQHVLMLYAGMYFGLLD